MGVNSLPKTVTRQRRDCDLNPGSSALESSKHASRSVANYRATPVINIGIFKNIATYIWRV